MLSGQYPPVSPTVHVHGWSFFAWYLLLPLQATLIQTRNIALHRTLGMASIGLASLMVLTGMVVIGTQVNRSLAPDGNPFWFEFGPGIFSTLVLFVGFYAAAILRRRQREYHKRFIVLASAGGLGAAAFRVLLPLFGFTPWVTPVGILLPNLFVVAAMVHDYRRDGQVHPVYRYGLPITLVLESAFLFVVHTPLGNAARQGLAWAGRLLGALYL
jgi:hypothetical protein